MSNEMRILKEFVEEFSPIHQGRTSELSYADLFEIVGDIVEAHENS